MPKPRRHVPETEAQLARHLQASAEAEILETLAEAVQAALKDDEDGVARRLQALQGIARRFVLAAAERAVLDAGSRTFRRLVDGRIVLAGAIQQEEAHHASA